MNLLEAKPPDPFLRSLPLSRAALFSSHHPTVFPSTKCSTPFALLSCSGLLFNVLKSKICLGRSEILGFEHSIETILDPLNAVLRSAYRKTIPAIQNIHWCIHPAEKQLKKQKSTKFFSFEVSTLMCEKEGIKSSNSLKAFYPHLLCSSNFQLIHFLESQTPVLYSHMYLVKSNPITGKFISPKSFL
ncbi:hypothetical protein Cgig2_024007 [Carnegiea gigantea]|uniref:Uncharacterized protein n=1 Tax=Carnegiea gigantea TaxID=171969 RepID=A0A9Q1KBK9_9CARY|nr:hypothetical protein Cgig2_024007 [Carnegiea gigantea]